MDIRHGVGPSMAIWGVKKAWRTAVVALLFLAAMAPAQEEPTRAQIAAATDTAVTALRESIAETSIGRNLTVKTLLDRTGGAETLTETLRRAQQIGGPRWIDEQTCQVRLEISGARVAKSLMQIAAANPKKSPISPEALAARLRDWDRRTFSA